MEAATIEAEKARLKKPELWPGWTLTREQIRKHWPSANFRHLCIKEFEKWANGISLVELYENVVQRVAPGPVQPESDHFCEWILTDAARCGCELLPVPQSTEPVHDAGNTIDLAGDLAAELESEREAENKDDDREPPTVEEIATACRKIRETWSDREYLRRAGMSDPCWITPVARRSTDVSVA